MWFLNLLVAILFGALNMVFGALSVDLAIYNFKRKNYFLFGLECFAALAFAYNMIEILIKI